MHRGSDFKAEPRGEREVVITRSFAARRELVFEALIRPALIRQWLGALKGWTMVECEFDGRVGGAYRYLWHGPNGERMGLRGVILEFRAPELIVSSEQYDDPWYPGDATAAFTLTEQGGRTTVVLTVTYADRATRDAVLGTGMASGVAASYDGLERILSAVTESHVDREER